MCVCRGGGGGGGVHGLLHANTMLTLLHMTSTEHKNFFLYKEYNYMHSLG